MIGIMTSCLLHYQEVLKADAEYHSTFLTFPPFAPQMPSHVLPAIMQAGQWIIKCQSEGEEEGWCQSVTNFCPELWLIVKVQSRFNIPSSPHCCGSMWPFPPLYSTILEKPVSHFHLVDRDQGEGRKMCSGDISQVMGITQFLDLFTSCLIPIAG